MLDSSALKLHVCLLSVCLCVYTSRPCYTHVYQKKTWSFHQTQAVRLGSRQVHWLSPATVLTCLTCLFVLTCVFCLLSYRYLYVHDNLDFTQEHGVCSAKPELYIYQPWT